MGFGFLESVYEKCLLIELHKASLKAESQKAVTVYYHGAPVGNFIVDNIVNDTIILELKSVRTVIKAHEVQLVNYLCCHRKACWSSPEFWGKQGRNTSKGSTTYISRQD